MVPRNVEEHSLVEMLEQELQGHTDEQVRVTNFDKYHNITGSRKAFLQGAFAPSRRQFIIASSMAAAGLLIKPLGVSEAQGGFWTSLTSFFQTFGTSILFSFLTQGTPGSIPGFGTLAQGFLNPLLLLLFTGGVFGNIKPGATPSPTPTASPTPTPSQSPSTRGQNNHGVSPNRRAMLISPSGLSLLPQPTKLLAHVGNAKRFNAGAAYLNKNNRSNKIIYPAQSYIGIQGVAKGVLANPDNLPQTTETVEAVKQNYYLPRWEGQFGRIAQETTRSTQPFTTNFPKPQFYESESGALVLVSYEAHITKRDRSGRPVEGQGKSVVYTVPPGERKDQVLGFVSENSNFWENDAVRRQLVEVMKANIATGSNVEGTSYAFAVA